MVMALTRAANDRIVGLSPEVGWAFATVSTAVAGHTLALPSELKTQRQQCASSKLHVLVHACKRTRSMTYSSN